MKYDIFSGSGTAPWVFLFIPAQSILRQADILTPESYLMNCDDPPPLETNPPRVKFRPVAVEIEIFKEIPEMNSQTTSRLAKNLLNK